MAYIRYTTDDENCAPYKKHRFDAGWDLRSNNETFTLFPEAKVIVDTGIKLGIPRKFVGLIMPRSGLGSKYRIGLANTVGVIDADYRGEVKVVLVNDGREEVVIEKYERICQLLIVPVELQSMRKVGLLDDTARGDGGFGSTDK